MGSVGVSVGAGVQSCSVGADVGWGVCELISLKYVGVGIAVGESVSHASDTSPVPCSAIGIGVGLPVAGVFIIIIILGETVGGTSTSVGALVSSWIKDEGASTGLFKSTTDVGVGMAVGTPVTQSWQS
jgi:hypothetical protein